MWAFEMDGQVDVYKMHRGKEGKPVDALCYSLRGNLAVLRPMSMLFVVETDHLPAAG